ncbi:hypothetical protein JCM11491_003335 [Sporobolomyces phaffii]
MRLLEDAVETLEPGPSYSHHPYSVDSRTERLLEQLDLEHHGDDHPIAVRAASFPHPLAPLAPIDESSPAPSPVASLASLQFDPHRDLASAWTLYPRQSHHDSSDTISVVSASYSVPTSSAPPRSSGSRPGPALAAPLGRTDSPATFAFGEDAKARRWDKKRGRRKLGWWGLFWLVVVGGTALGIGIAAAVKSKSNDASLLSTSSSGTTGPAGSA